MLDSGILALDAPVLIAVLALGGCGGVMFGRSGEEEEQGAD